MRLIIFFIHAIIQVSSFSINSRAAPRAVQRTATNDFIDPISRGANFGDPMHSYWGASRYEKLTGKRPPMNEGVYEVILERPLGIVFEEVPTSAS